MQFALPCECGASLRVTATQAGSDVVCRCGRSVPVPRLSQLRELAGKGAYEASTLDTIHRMIREGQLPPDRICAISQEPTDDTFHFHVVCESVWKRGYGKTSRWLTALAILFVPGGFICAVFCALLGWKEFSQQQELGRDRGISVPLRIHRRYHDKLLRTRSQRRLRALLRTVPIYDQLLADYSRAYIHPEGAEAQ